MQICCFPLLCIQIVQMPGKTERAARYMSVQHRTEKPCTLPARTCCMCTFSRMTVIINICMIFRYIQDHTDTYHLLYDGPGSLFKSTVFEHFFRWRKKNNWLCRLLSFPAVPFVAGLPAWSSACFFPVVCDLFTSYCF